MVKRGSVETDQYKVQKCSFMRNSGEHFDAYGCGMNSK